MRAAAESDAVWIIFIICVRSVPYKYVERHHPRLSGTRARPRTGAQREDSAGVRALAGGDSRHGSRVCVEGVTATSRAGSDGSQPVLALLLESPLRIEESDGNKMMVAVHGGFAELLGVLAQPDGSQPGCDLDPRYRGAPPTNGRLRSLGPRGIKQNEAAPGLGEL